MNIGTLKGSIHFVQDITLRKTLEKSSKRLVAIVESSDDAIIGKDLNGTITNWNMGAQKMYGYSADEIIGKHVSMMVPPFLEGDLSQIMLQIKNGNSIKNYDTVRQKKNGELINVSLSISPIFDNDKTIVGASTIASDITERKKSEYLKQEMLEKEQKFSKKLQKVNDELREQQNELFKVNLDLFESQNRFSKAFHNNPAAMTLVNEKGEYIDVNESYAKLTGYSRAELIGTNSKELNIIDNSEQELKLEDSNDRSVKDVKLEIKTKSGEKRTVLINSESIKFRNKLNSISFIYDITDLKKAEEELEQTLGNLKRSNFELEQFAYVASHDLKEPLRMVTSFLQLLQRRYEDQLDLEANEFINFAVDGAKRMHYLIEDLLAYSRVMTKGKAFKEVDMDEVLEKVKMNLKVKIEENQVKITQETLPTIDADELQMIQLLQNLIENSIKYRSEKSPEITVSAKKDDNDWIFTVKDNGIGFDPKHGDHIFLIFKRLHTNEEYEGTGIGLAIIKRIVQRHYGSVWAKSELGKGSTFYFSIPENNDPIQ